MTSAPSSTLLTHKCFATVAAKSDICWRQGRILDHTDGGRWQCNKGREAPIYWAMAVESLMSYSVIDGALRGKGLFGHVVDLSRDCKWGWGYMTLDDHFGNKNAHGLVIHAWGLGLQLSDCKQV